VKVEVQARCHELATDRRADAADGATTVRNVALLRRKSLDGSITAAPSRHLS